MSVNRDDTSRKAFIQEKTCYSTGQLQACLYKGLAIQNVQADEADRVTGWGCCIDHEDPCPFRALLVPPH